MLQISPRWRFWKFFVKPSRRKWYNYEPTWVSLRPTLSVSTTSWGHKTSTCVVGSQLGLQLDRRVSSCGPLSLQPDFLLVLTVPFQNWLDQWQKWLHLASTAVTFCAQSLAHTHTLQATSHLTFSRARLEECLPSMHQGPGLISALPKIGWMLMGIPSL